jgi:chaperonin cofactor prefoldin
VPLYFLYDTKSPGAKMLEQGYIEAIRHLDTQSSAVIREFLDPPQPLFQSGFVQPVNPHHQSAQIASQHNIQESAAKGIESLTKNATQAEELLSQECQEILAELKNLPKDSCVVLVQSTNFRLSAFRIRLELFQRGIHVIEHNHLAYIPEQQLPTLVSALEYRSDTYARQHKELETLLSNASSNIHIKTPEGDVLTF